MCESGGMSNRHSLIVYTGLVTVTQIGAKKSVLLSHRRSADSCSGKMNDDTPYVRTTKPKFPESQPTLAQTTVARLDPFGGNTDRAGRRHDRGSNTRRVRATTQCSDFWCHLGRAIWLVGRLSTCHLGRENQCDTNQLLTLTYISFPL